ncbi:5611_t:CDS:2 [Paraglomus occultum]|uniref:5611_t:CDS:1 n=1 Tax=Paraglomus occultum TaxID=144539 RepID=A0A9N9AX89_9GLOM|nr:5611_t:CDS:2 [Paraglomus occultum]
MASSRKILKELDENRKHERVAYFELWVSYALDNDPTNATLFRNKYDKSGDEGRNNIVGNIRTYFSLKIQTAPMSFRQAVAEAFDVNYLNQRHGWLSI